MADVQGSDILVLEIIFLRYNFWPKLLHNLKSILFIKIPTVYNYDLSLFPLEQKINKEIRLHDPFDRAIFPLGIIQVIDLLGK